MTTLHSRRNLLRWMGSAPLAWLATALQPLSAWAADWPKALFDSATSQAAIGALGAQSAAPGTKILLDVPEIADRNDQLVVRVLSTLPATEQITILVDKALRPVVAQFNLSADTEPDVSTTIKLPGTSTIRAVVKAGGKLYTVSKEVKLSYPAETETAPAKSNTPKKANKA